ncbi:MAG: 50S ribosomal protein L5 [Candidatus Methanolliviera sp. GoM_oil]|nr:MAG: 50S ribosomal protein L5 [Candidatus Methanolliviera sp. GoM_oil]
MSENPMRKPRIEKVLVHMGVGESGGQLINAEKVLEAITGQKTTRTFAKRTRPIFGIKKGEPIGCKVTLRKQMAKNFLKDALNVVENTIYEDCFDETGNFSFGLEEHLLFPNMKYDPKIGIFGMDVTVVLERPGKRIEKRKINRGKVSKVHKINKEEAIEFTREHLEVKVE